jgi:hypothetical protein
LDRTHSKNLTITCVMQIKAGQPGCELVPPPAEDALSGVDSGGADVPGGPPVRIG